MTVKELEEQLDEIEDKSLRIDVSCDISSGQDDTYNRLFANPLHIQNDGSFITLICEKSGVNLDIENKVYKPNCCNECTFVDECFSEKRIKCADYETAIKEYDRGLAEGRKEKWHNLREDPNDLPKHSGLYCVQCGEVREYVKEEKSWFTVHFEPCMNSTEETYLWCELPKFEE